MTVVVAIEGGLFGPILVFPFDLQLSIMATGGLAKFLSGLTPPPLEIPATYEGWEFKWKMFVFRPACKFFFF